MTNTSFIGGVQGNRHLDPNKPYSGFKIAMFKLNKEGEIDLIPPHYHYKVTKLSADSLCKKTHESSESFSSCSCGFYSYGKIADAADHAGQFNNAHNCFFVEVTLSGFVVIAEKGYKSSHQRVKTIVVGQCCNCDEELSSKFVVHESGYLLGCCDNCEKYYNPTDIMTFEVFQQKTQVEGFNPIATFSSKINSNNLNEVFGNYDKNLAITNGVRELIESEDLVSLMNQRLVIDDAIKILSDKEGL